MYVVFFYTCVRYHSSYSHTNSICAGNLNELNQRYTSSNTVPPPPRAANISSCFLFFNFRTSFVRPPCPAMPPKQHFIYVTNTQTPALPLYHVYFLKENKSQLNNTTVLIKIYVLYRTAAKDLSEVA